jgi:hypothetical protein
MHGSSVGELNITSISLICVNTSGGVLCGLQFDSCFLGDSGSWLLEFNLVNRLHDNFELQPTIQPKIPSGTVFPETGIRMLVTKMFSL